jgi:hypothetical protein
LQANLCTERFLKKLVGRKDIEDALVRLDKLTQDEARMATAQILKLTHVVDNKVTGVRNKLKEMEDKIDVVIKGVPDLLAIYRPILIAHMLARWKGHKCGYPANVKQRCQHEMFVTINIATTPVFLTRLQGTDRENISENGLLHLIHQRITTSHATFTMGERPSGSLKAVYSQDGSQMALSCGYMVNIHSSLASQIVPDHRLHY